MALSFFAAVQPFVTPAVFHGLVPCAFTQSLFTAHSPLLMTWVITIVVQPTIWCEPEIAAAGQSVWMTGTYTFQPLPLYVTLLWESVTCTVDDELYFWTKIGWSVSMTLWIMPLLTGMLLPVWRPDAGQAPLPAPVMA